MTLSRMRNTYCNILLKQTMEMKCGCLSVKSNQDKVKAIKLKALEDARKINPASSWLDIAESFIDDFPAYSYDINAYRSDRQELRREVLKEVQAGKEKFDFYHQIDIICSKYPCIGVK